MSVNKFGTNRELHDLLRIIGDVKLLNAASDLEGAEFARENKQLITGDHQNIDKFLEELDSVTTRLSTMEDNHQNIDKFLKAVSQNTLA